MDFVIYHKTKDNNAINVETFNAGITHTLELIKILYDIDKNKIDVVIYPLENSSVKVFFRTICIIGEISLVVINFTETDHFNDLYKDKCGTEFNSLYIDYGKLVTCFKQFDIKTIDNTILDEKTREVLKKSNSKYYKTAKKDNNVPAIAFNTTPTEKDLILRQDFHKYITEEDNEDETYRVILYMQSAPANDNNTATFQANDNYTNFPVKKNVNFMARFSEDCGFESIEDFNKHKPYKFDVEIIIKKNGSKVISKIISLNGEEYKKSSMEYDTIYTAKEETNQLKLL